MSGIARPEKLPAPLWPLWERLAREDAATGSRRALAAKLRVSTHTLQRILVEGSVPDLRIEKSTYVVSSWVRTLTRIAHGLGMDAAALVESVGLDASGRNHALIEAEISKLEGQPAERSSAQCNQSLSLAGFLTALMSAGEKDDDDSLREARKQVQEALERFLTASGRKPPGMAGAGDLADGRFCRSCMASLSDPYNKGASVQFCRWCSDDEGRLKPEPEVHEILTRWFLHWQDGITPAQAADRARHYMLAMPAWAPRPANQGT